MDYQYFEDPIESYESEGDTSYYNTDCRTFHDDQYVADNSELQDDYYYDELDPELFSPPASRIEPNHGRREVAFMHPANVDCRIEEPFFHRARQPMQRLCVPQSNIPGHASDEFENPGVHNRPSRLNSYHLPKVASAPQEGVHSNSTNRRGVRLRPVSELPDIYRGLFKFGVFNAVQSTCFDEIFAGEKNLVVSAPTGSGKTVLFELGIIRMVERSNNTGKQGKCIYVAPTKALCSEKFKDWVTKFEPIGLKCCELTGDTMIFGHNAWGEARNASIIVTTCEKWDSLTRNWHDHEHILSQIQLFLVDEVHILNETRGSTLEVVTSRMKLRGSSIRFILVSATVPNIIDVACWIGSGGSGTSEAAKVFEFGDAYRPCQLTRHVVGVHRRNGMHDFQFGKVLEGKLFAVLQQFSVGKPILVFCSTRKGVLDTAERLMKEYIDAEGKKSALPWSRPARITHSFYDKRLDELAYAGIGVHHAGISMDDRKATEQLYLKKDLRILVATSTLAVGVNLPAHMVVIKGVRTFQNNVSKEYTDLDIMQMLGRAGRPQYDKDGIAVILCESELEHKYKALVQGKTILESSLHTNLAEHINSEIGLGTIKDVETAKSWLRSSFLYQRIQKNPGYYAVGSDDTGQKRGEGVEDVVMQSISQLKKTLLIEHVEHGSDIGKLSSTQYGEIMSKYYIRRATMDLILALPKHASLREILESICSAEEFQDVKLRGSEKKIFNDILRKDVDIRFAVKKVGNTADKIFLLVQAVLAGISLNSPEYRNSDSQLHMDAFVIFKHIARISRAALDVAVVRKDGLQIKNGFELFRSLSSKAWEDRAIVFRQIEQIGEKSIKVLAEHGITSFSILRTQDPLRIETLLNRRPPFGLDILASVAELPQYDLKVKEIGVQSDGGKSPVQIDLLIECGLAGEKAPSSKPRKQRNRPIEITVVLTLTSDMDLIDLRRIPTKALKAGKKFELTTELKKPSQNVIIIVTPEDIAGVALQHVYKPNVPPGEYPTLDTRPLSSVEMDLAGLEDDPDFWNMGLDNSSGADERPTVKHEGDIQRTTKPGVGKIPSVREIKSGLEKSGRKSRIDGRYECNHPCKDKTQCRHFCCRDGLVEPPHASKRISPRPPVSNPKLPSNIQRLHTTSTGPVTAQKESQSLKALDLIHDRSQVATNLKLIQGQRLNLESPRPLKRKRRSTVEYDISFTDLADPELESKADFSETHSDSEELPETILLDSTLSSQIRHQKMASPTRIEEPRSKRMKYSDPAVKLAEKKEMLFLELSDSEGSVEILTPKLSYHLNAKTKSNESEGGEPNEANSSKEKVASDGAQTQHLDSGFNTYGLAEILLKKNKPGTEIEVDSEFETVQSSKDEVNIEFAELDAWLQSGSIEIL